MGLVLCIGLPAYLTLCAGACWFFGSATKLGETAEERRLKDLDEAAGLYAQALVRRDTRRIKQATEAFVSAKNAVLAAEIGWQPQQKTPPA